MRGSEARGARRPGRRGRALAGARRAPAAALLGLAVLCAAGCAKQVTPAAAHAAGAARGAAASQGAARPKEEAAPLERIPLQERLGRLSPGAATDFSLPPQRVPGAGSYSFHAVGIPIEDALRLFARDHDLNLVIDPGLTGELTVDFQSVSLDDALHAILDAHGYSWERRGGLIRVRRLQTRTFEVDYLRLVREGRAISVSGQFGVTGGGAEGAADEERASEYEVRQSNPVAFWDELTVALEDLVGEEGRFSINRTAGIVSVTADGRRMQEVAQYLEAVQRGSLRQVRIEARIVEVELDDRNRLGIDWSAPDLARLGRYDVAADLLSGGGVIPGADLDITSTVTFATQGEVRAVLNALSEQGRVNVVSQPKIVALNNQTAQIRVATDTPYFVQTKSAVPASVNEPGQPAQFEQRTASLGLLLQVTPHVSGDGWITLQIVPVITRSTGRVPSPDPEFAASAGPLIVDVKQTAAMARVRSGETVVLGGLIQEDAREDVTRVPLLGDLPMVGGLFRDTTRSDRRSELVVFVTPVAEEPGAARRQAAW